MSQQPDAIIIGTGVIGTAVAFEMAKNGWKTLSLDRNAQIGHGSTAGSCAIIRMHYSTFDGTAFAWEGYHYWRDWKAYLGLPDGHALAQFKECGCMVMRTEANGNLDKHLENSRDLDIPVEEWDEAAILDKLPIYSLASFSPPRRIDDPEFGTANGNRIGGALYWPNGGYVTDPALSSQNLADAARQHGAEFRLGVEVVEILKEDGRVRGVKLASGEEIHAKVVVNVAGPGSAHINGLAGVTDEMTIKTRPLRQEVAHVPAPEGFDFDSLGMVVSDSDIACYIRPEHGNNILVGSEDPECDDREWVDPDDYNREFTEQWTTQAYRMGQRIPSLGIPSRMKGCVDLYDVSDDWIPIYDKSSVDGFYMAIGTSGNQFKNAPVAGAMMAALIEHCEGGEDHDRNPLQFPLHYVDGSIDVGFYSRLREINPESSFSVIG